MWPIFGVTPQQPGGAGSGTSILTTLKEGVDLAKSGAEVYSTIQASRTRPTPATNAPSSNGEPHPGAAGVAFSVGPAILIGALLIGGFFVARALMR